MPSGKLNFKPSKNLFFFSFKASTSRRPLRLPPATAQSRSFRTRETPLAGGAAITDVLKPELPSLSFISLIEFDSVPCLPLLHATAPATTV